jgi:cytoskeletal protein CcmA (bactofilin family)
MMWRTRQGRAPRMRGRVTAFLDEESEIEGRYTCAGTVVFDAKFSGEITLVGDVYASTRVELKATARLIGNIEAPVIVMEEGAVHEGHSRMRNVTREAEASSSESTGLSLVVSTRS